MSLVDEATELPDDKDESARVKSLKRELAEAKKLIELQKQLIENQRQSSVKAVPAVKRSVKGGSFVRGILSDTHGSAVDEVAFETAMQDFEAVGVTQILHLGDAMDCGGFLAERHAWGYVAETAYTFADDVAAANHQFDRICSIASDIHFIEGNHDRRLETWCITESLKATRGKSVGYHVDALLAAYAVENVLSLKKRGVQHYKQGHRYDCETPATIRLGKAVFTHGEFTNKHAATKHAESYGTNVFHGHTHRAQFDYIKTGLGEIMVGGCHGCLCKLQPLWCHTRPTRWTHGYGIHLVRPDGSFLPIHVPIIGGQSLLADLADKIR